MDQLPRRRRHGAFDWAGVGKIICLCFLAFFFSICAAKARTLTSSREVRDFPNAEAGSSIEVKLTGTVTFYDQGWGMMFFQDSTGAIYVDPGKKPLGIVSGQFVELQGKLAPGDMVPIVREPRFSVLQTHAGPAVARYSMTELLEGKGDCQLVQIEGVLRGVQDLWGRTALRFATSNRVFRALVLGPPDKRFEQQIGAKVRLRGVCGIQASGRQITNLQFHVSSFDDVFVVEQGRSNPYDLPLSDGKAFQEKISKQDLASPLRVQGQVGSWRGSTVELHTSFGRLELAVDRSLPLTPGLVIDAVGFVRSGTTNVLEDLLVRRVGVTQNSPSTGSGRVLTEVQQLREWDFGPTNRNAPARVRIRGVVTYYDRAWKLLFVQDRSGGTYVHTHEQELDLSSGDYVQVEGFAAPGDFAPRINHPSIQILGRGGLPAPLVRRAEQLSSGFLDGQWVEVSGVVQKVTPREPHYSLELSDGGTLMEVILPGQENRTFAEGLLGAVVRVRAVCGSKFNDRRQIQDPILYVPGLAQVQVIRGAPADQFSMPREEIGALLQFRPQQQSEQRVHVAGTVTYFSDGFGYVEDGTGAAAFQTAAGVQAPEVGSSVSVLGFPRWQYGRVSLREALLRNGAVHSAPASPQLAIQDVLGGAYNLRLVSIKGRLLQETVRQREISYLLEHKGETIEAILSREKLVGANRAVRIGSELEVKGVVVRLTDDWRALASSALLLRSPEDLKVLRAATWWNRQRVTLLLVVTGIGSVLAVLWGLALRRRVGQQTRIIREKLEREAALQENYRQLIENANDVVYTHDLDGRISSWNAAGERILGYSREEILGRNLRELLLPSDVGKVEKALGEKLQHHGITTYEISCRHKRGSSVILEVSSRLVLQNGKAIGVQGSARDVTARKEADRALAEERNLLRTLLDNLPDCVYIKDLQGRYVLTNSANAELLGESDTRAVCGKSVYDYFSPEVASAFQKDDWPVLEKGQSLVNREEPFTTSTGSPGWFLTTKVPLRDLHGKVIGLIGISRNITENKEAEAALRESQRTLSTLMRNLPGMAYRWCLRKGSLAFASHGALQLTGYSAEELVGNSSARELLPEADLKELSSQVGKAMQQHGTFTVVHRLKVKSGDFKWVWSQGSAVTDDADQVIAIEGFVLDISEQKRAEEELRLSEARFSKIFKIGPVAIGITTVEEGRFLDVNESFCQLMATTREEVIGKTALELDLWIDPTQRAAIIADLQRLQPVRNRECQVRARDGRKIHVLASVELLTLGNQPAMLFLANDITDRMNLEAQLRQSQKMEAIGQLAAGVAHDFNNIMTIIQGYTTLAVSRSSDVSQVEECLHQVSQASERAANLTRQLLTFSRKQLIQQKAVDLNEVVNNVTKLLSRLLGETVVLECSYGSGLPKILADEGMIEQVLMNLAVNARDAMPKGGTLQIQVRAVSPDELIRRGQSRARGVHVCLSVTDTGCGMDEKTMARIFEPFFTTKEVGKGTGLGLATVYAILEQHGGWVEVESQVEKGSTFSLYFPGQPQSIEREKKPQLPAVVPGGKETILVVEDEAALRLLVRKILERYGYRIIEAVSGQEALDLWQRHSKTIDLLLTDMVMPEGMSGRELAARLQQEKATLKVIYTSGYSIDMADESFCLEEGVNFLSKPYHPPTLARVVRNTLDQNSAFQTK